VKNIVEDKEVKTQGTRTPESCSAAVGDDTCITSPSIGHNLETGGEDTADFSLYVQWEDEMFSKLCEELKKAQHAARDDAQGFKGDILVVDGREFIVSPAGAKGKAKGSPYYAWVCESHGLRIKVADRVNPHEKIPNVSVHAGSLLLMQAGIEGVWADVQAAIEKLGGEIVRDKLTRIDACVDLPGVDVGVFTRALNDGCVITRARKRAIHFNGDRPTGMTCGAGATMVRMYDKALEVRQRGDEAKQLYLEKFRWGGPQKTATRVEFQLRRDALKSLGVDSVDDWIEKRAAIVAYLTGQWCRLVVDVDKSNQNHGRAALLAEWQVVADAFVAWVGRAAPAKRNKTAAPDADALMKQAAGCLMSAYAVNQPDSATGIDEVFGYYVDRLWRILELDGPDHLERLARRRKVLESQGRAEPTAPKTQL